MFEILVEQRGRDATLRGTVRARQVFIGRDEGSDLVLKDEEISRRHCRLTITGAGVVVVDLDSTNGTFVNGARVRAPVSVNATDQVALGEFRLRVQWVPDHDRASEPARRASPWEILGVSSRASRSELRAAYLQRVRQYHPDRVAGLGAALIALAEEKMREINWAYEVLAAGGA